MNLKKVIYFVILFLLSSCQKQKETDKNFNEPKEEIRSMNTPSRSIIDIQGDVYKGDEKAYWELRIAYLDYPPENFLFWALLMANKYDNSQAYLDVFWCLVHSSEVGDICNFEKMDMRTKKMALEYLTIASQKSVGGASETLRQIKTPCPPQLLNPTTENSK